MTTKARSPPAASTTYEKLDPISHMLKRPDMYIGSVKTSVQEEWVFNMEENKMVREEVNYNAGLSRILIEILSNVIDNVWRSRIQSIPVDKVQVTIETDSVTVTNDGHGIPFTLYKDTQTPIPELIFGHLMTSTNYNDEEERLTSGTYGVGANCTNVFSKRFEIELHNKDSQQSYRQVWKNNMRDCSPPIIKPKKVQSNLVKIHFFPDFERFGISSKQIEPDVVAQFYKYCVDVSMITRIPVYINKKKINIKQFADYVRLYPVSKKECILINKEEDLEVALCSSEDGYQEIVFTNGVFNRHGGVHVDTIMNEICKSLLQKVNTKLKSTLGVKDVKKHFQIFVNCKLVNPTFNSQSKERLTSPNIKYTFDTKHVPALLKWSFMDKMKESLQMKEMKSIKKLEKKRIHIDGYDAANLSGTKKSQECTLVLCEGLSAKTYAINGMNVGWNNKKGRDYWGVYPMRGVCLNVRNATLQNIMNNKELMDIANILNLRYNQKNDVRDLNYGRVILLTDADVDGNHIASLLLNFFDILYPDILKSGFVFKMLTPIAKVKDRLFYSDSDYADYLRASQGSPSVRKGTQPSIKYYKGLGTSSAQDIRETFGQKVVRFVYDDDARQNLDKVFNQKFSNERKAWLEKYDPSEPVPAEMRIDRNDSYQVSNFINHELVRFSIYDCRRSLPNLFDGLKLSQRKILYAVFKKNLLFRSNSMKVAQLAGYVAEVSNYHHGEQCLHDTIIRMTHDYVGSQNLPLLFPDGQFGTRLALGKDAASGRYIFTKLQRYTPNIFCKADEPLLNYLYDDNDIVEPEYYVPVIPTILVNGCSTGIGTGWSCHIPCHDIGEIISETLRWVSHHENKEVENFRMKPIAPSWKGFKGRIQKITDNKYTSFGVFDREPNKGVVTVSEIPIGISIEKYKDFLESLLEQKKIKQFKNYSTTDKVRFEFVPVQENFGGDVDHTSLKLCSTIHLTNMVLFSKANRLQKFHSIHDILHVFCLERLRFYELRKAHQIDHLERLLRRLRNQHRFLNMVLDQELRLHSYQEGKEITDALVRMKFDKSDDDGGDFNYLLNMSVRQMTKTRLQDLADQIQRTKEELSALRETSVYDLWRRDIHDLERQVSMAGSEDSALASEK